MLPPLKNRNLWLILTGDVFLLSLAYFFAYYLRFDGEIPAQWAEVLAGTIFWLVPMKLACLAFFDLYKGMWRYTSLHDALNLLKAAATSSIIFAMVQLLLLRFYGFSRGIALIDFLLTVFFIGGFRFSIRLAHVYGTGQGIPFVRHQRGLAKKVLILGAGDAGEKLIREMRESHNLVYDLVGIVDDDPHKLNQAIHGVPVMGTLGDLEALTIHNRVDEVIIAMPSASALQMRQIVNHCEAAGIPYKTIPGLGELIEGRISVSAIRDVRYEDLLGRKPVELDMKEIGAYLTGRPVMVTGGAGSIGSELCRQIAPFNPSRLVIVDQNESGLYEMEMDFLAKLPTLPVSAVLASVQERERMVKIFQEHRPEVLFHAAAYKHVPMMEVHPWEAVYNNILGTKNVLELCRDFGVERYVVVSTDKAVRPTNVMGASKRVGEILAQCCAMESGTRCMAVRFGNVVGSVGSVIPLFKKQIQNGGPVTVTHPEVTRYFMTIPEATRLILQAGAMGNGGEIFILRMGTPVRISDMARDMITLSGYKPDEEIEIRYTGLRPGEKLYEELITEGEGILETEREEIMVLKADSCMPSKELEKHIRRLMKLADDGDGEGIKAELHELVAEYSPWEAPKQDEPPRREAS